MIYDGAGVGAGRALKDLRDPKGPKALKDPKDLRDPKDLKDPKHLQGPHRLNLNYFS